MSDQKPTGRCGAGRGKMRTEGEMAPPGPSATAEQLCGKGIASGPVPGRIARIPLSSVQMLTEEKEPETVLPNSDDQDDDEMLRRELQVLVLPQGMVSKGGQNISNRDTKSWQSLVLKINDENNKPLQTGGIWSILTNANSGTLFIGIDVSHPTPSENGSPSVAAAVSNIDFAATRYSASIRMQRRQQGQTQMNLEETIRQRIVAFQMETDAKPARLIVYRDGVVESQFEEVMRSELMDIRKACASIETLYRPNVTYMVATKRHHTRLVVDRGNERGRSRNIPVGTIVDMTVTSPALFGFYLCNRLDPRAPSRPLRCTVLHDENKFPANQIQAITYELSNMNSRDTRSVGTPIMLYYAHWACLRGQYNLAPNLTHLESETLSEGVSSTIGENELRNDARSRM